MDNDDTVIFKAVEPSTYAIAVGDTIHKPARYEVYLNGVLIGHVEKHSEASRRKPKGLRYTTGLIGYAVEWKANLIPELRSQQRRTWRDDGFGYTRAAAVKELVAAWRKAKGTDR